MFMMMIMRGAVRLANGPGLDTGSNTGQTERSMKRSSAVRNEEPGSEQSFQFTISNLADSEPGSPKGCRGKN